MQAIEMLRDTEELTLLVCGPAKVAYELLLLDTPLQATQSPNTARKRLAKVAILLATRSVSPNGRCCARSAVAVTTTVPFSLWQCGEGIKPSLQSPRSKQPTNTACSAQLFNVCPEVTLRATPEPRARLLHLCCVLLEQA